MKFWITRFAAGCLAVASLGLNACKKDETRAVLTPGAKPTLTASTTTPNLVLTTANSNAAATTFNYTAADFGYQAAVTYTLQFDKKGGNFASPAVYTAGNVAGAASLTTAQLVNIFTSLGYPFNTASQVDVRVVASVGAAVAPLVSSVITLTGTPVPLCIPNPNGDWGLVGTAVDGWPGNPLPAAQPDRMLTYDCYTQTFSLRTTFTTGAFKLRANRAWATSLGAAAATYSYPAGVALSTSGADLLITTPGTYTVTLALTNDTNGNLTGGTVTLKP